MAWAQGHSHILHESIIHHSGPLLKPRGVKDKNLGTQKMSTGNMVPFAEQRSEHHFSIQQTRICANKGKADAVWVGYSMFIQPWRLKLMIR